MQKQLQILLFSGHPYVGLFILLVTLGYLSILDLFLSLADILKLAFSLSSKILLYLILVFIITFNSVSWGY